eukprot:15120685-Alexandrium_andersonii.AAC.1
MPRKREATGTQSTEVADRRTPKLCGRRRRACNRNTRRNQGSSDIRAASQRGQGALTTETERTEDEGRNAK